MKTHILHPVNNTSGHVLSEHIPIINQHTTWHLKPPSNTHTLALPHYQPQTHTLVMPCRIHSAGVIPITIQFITTQVHAKFLLTKMVAAGLLDDVPRLAAACWRDGCAAMETAETGAFKLCGGCRHAKYCSVVSGKQGGCVHVMSIMVCIHVSVDCMSALGLCP